MIVSSINRSGSTKYCLDLANELCLPFYDEPFEYEVAVDHKQYLHEIGQSLTQSKSISFLNSIDLDKSVVNNHNINYLTLRATSRFLSRQNVQDSIWSYIAYMDRYFKYYKRPSSVFLPFVIDRMLSKTLYFYEYCTESNVNIIVPDLTYKNNLEYRETYSRYKEKVDSIKNLIKLPIGFEYH